LAKALTLLPEGNTSNPEAVPGRFRSGNLPGMARASLTGMEMQRATEQAKNFVKNNKLLVGGAALATGLLVTGKWKPVLGTLGIRVEEEPKHEVLEKEGRFQLRSYSPSLIARTMVSGSYEDAGDTAFKSLFDFIGKGNAEGKKLPMTVPVYQARVGKGEDSAWMMSFFMPAKHSLQTLPKPTDEDVEIHLLPERKVAVYRFSGDQGESAFKHAANRLLKWAKGRGLRTKGEPILALYDQPFSLPFRRRNEVHLFVE
jgi:effector-binding domain-containing protein